MNDNKIKSSLDYTEILVHLDIIRKCVILEFSMCN